jgi:mono/diheme cytochrome c family protein
MPRYIFVMSLFLIGSSLQAAEEVTLEQIKAAAAAQSKYRSTSHLLPVSNEAPKADTVGFRAEIGPILTRTCLKCHGPDEQKGKFRIDTLNPDMIHGEDAKWWVEVTGRLTNGEMPPEDEVEMADADRAKVIDWLSGQILVASQVQRSEGAHSSFRRMTRYEFNYALQDLLGLSQDFGGKLPPETVSEDGFQNSSEMMQMTSRQFATYQDIARESLQYATVRGPRPEPLFFSITMDKAGPYYGDWARENLRVLETEKANGLPPGENEQNHQDNIDAFRGIVRGLENASRPTGGDRGGRGGRGGVRGGLGRGGFGGRGGPRASFLNLETGESLNRSLPYGFSLWQPTDRKPVDPEGQVIVLALPHGASQQIDLGNYLPDRGTVKIRFRANRASAKGDSFPSLRLSFGYQPSNNSSHDYVISEEDIAITAVPGKPQFYEWLIQMDGIQRNPFLRKSRLGIKPNASEYFIIRNVHQGSQYADQAAVHIDYIEVTAPYVTEWPPTSHRRVFPEQAQSGDEEINARRVLASFMPKVWRRPVTEEELEQRLVLFQKIRPAYEDFQEAMIEVLAGVLASPNFLYLAQSDESITDSELASRLSFFLWSSQPDETLLKLASSGRLRDPGTLAQQAERMLADPRADRFAEQFTRQWLGMELLDHLVVDKEVYPEFSEELKHSMEREPIAFFQHVLNEDRSVMDFLHADYALVNQRLAEFYGMDWVFGNRFQKISLPPESRRGGLLTQAGLLAMNSDGKDSHPLKRGIWLLKSILHDPPPPPPPAVPAIDLADPRILKMTLKERMTDHRSDPACFSCHSKIDPWGIAFEEFDATGAWRDEINGKPVDATSRLYNQSELAGIEGLERYLLENRQDQFAQAMVHKLASYALGRPLSFADRAELERITAKLRQKGDGLRTLIQLLVESDLFRTN